MIRKLLPKCKLTGDAPYVERPLKSRLGHSGSASRWLVVLEVCRSLVPDNVR